MLLKNRNFLQSFFNKNCTNSRTTSGKIYKWKEFEDASSKETLIY